MPLKIGIDGRALQGNLTGVGVYIYELCRHLDKYLPDAVFFIYTNAPVTMPVIAKRWLLRFDSGIIARHLKPVLWLKVRCGYFCRKDELDIFWGTASFLPKLPAKVKTITTVFDLNFKICPETMSFAHLLAHKLFFVKDLRKTEKIITISQGTSKKIFKLTGRMPDGVVRPGASEYFSPQPEDKVKDYLKTLGINKPYILSVATWEPRKNLQLLINVFLAMKKQGLLPRYKLVLAGGSGWKDRQIHDLLESKFAKDNIIQLGHVPHSQLPMIYSGAEIFAFPSQYEGFGIPVLEARSCGVKIVTSDTSELREAGGDDAVYVKPTFEGIRDGLMLSINQAKKHAFSNNLPTWEESAKDFLKFL
jgi:glycosyltransferase involved in cell wall biosynthesis